ncbi:MAG: DUF2723 domain-containing protein [Flavobacteriaceae bacterium]|jgi:hypothetical protein|tara:strand:- start:12951 stop:16226 length:3276 start_codon:yes stop_codon:yes gene_type:complete
MTVFNFEKWNRIVGWSVFAIALTTYWLTVEPTVSFWDAGEYITTASNLEVGHPPGAPLYQIVGAFFSIFALEPTNIALTINLMSVFASAFTVLFLFWSLSLLLKRLAPNGVEQGNTNDAAIIGSAAVGALAFAFTDSFWFSAVEAEVYAAATFVLSALFYCGLRWQNDMFTPRGDRWLILIAFIIGLSFGIHFMGLLTIPAIGFLYFFKKYPVVTAKNFIWANIIVVAVLLFIFKLLLPWTLKFFSAAELFFVNTLQMPFNSGTAFAGILFVALFYFGLTQTQKRGLVQANTLILCVLFIFIGFSSWLMLPIRANAGTVINENNPNNARELLAYYNREQYPETHLFYGPQFTEVYAGLDPDNPYKDDKPKYEKDRASGKYIIVNEWENAAQNTDDAQKALLPRMWSSEHSGNYLSYTGGLEFGIKRAYRNEARLVEEVSKFKEAHTQGLVSGKEYHEFLKRFSPFLDIKKPSMLDNLNFMFVHQFGYMYWRYFMWNFAGRQNDVQGQGSALNGNWLSGISWFDSLRLGPQDNLPSDLAQNKARNTYYFLPLILGVLGMAFHVKREKSSFWVLMVFFLFTGLALKVYLNERPYEPRERDYAIVGSFYVFAMWIGYGAYALIDLLKERWNSRWVVPIGLALSMAAAPVLLAVENWDDHDRSERRTANSMGKMYLDSCDPNAILFTIGDNDTFALWYQQNIEQYRQDVRIVNTSLFQTDWYIDDMKKQAFESAPIPSQLTHEQYRYGVRDVIAYQETLKDTIDIETWMNFVASEDRRFKVELNSGQFINAFPSKVVRIPVDKEAVLANGIVAPEDADLIVPFIDIELSGDFIYKNRILMLDIIANNNWERPIYFSGGAFGDDDYLWMKDYLQLDGMAYKLVPIKTPVDPRNPYQMGRINSDKMFDIVMDWDWGGSGNPAIYHDTETRRNGITYRSNLARLADQLIQERKFDRAETILDLGMEKMPVDLFEYYSLLDPFVWNYYEIGALEKARLVFEQTAQKHREYLVYYGQMTLQDQLDNIEEIYSKMNQYEGLVLLVNTFDQASYYQMTKTRFINDVSGFRNLFERVGLDLEEEFLQKERPTDSLALPESALN